MTTEDKLFKYLREVLDAMEKLARVKDTASKCELVRNLMNCSTQNTEEFKHDTRNH